MAGKIILNFLYSYFFNTSDPNLDELRVEVVAMATCLPFFGLLDLREILETILVAKASTVSECRPQKVIHYLKVSLAFFLFWCQEIQFLRSHSIIWFL